MRSVRTTRDASSDKRVAIKAAPVLTGQQLAWGKAFQRALMQRLAEENFTVPKDIMFAGRLDESASYRNVLDWLEFFFDGTVERGVSVAGGQVSHIATFTPRAGGAH